MGSSGTDVALETADAAILRDRVTDVAGTIRLARATMANIRQNIVIALGLKLVFLVTTILGITGLWDIDTRNRTAQSAIRAPQSRSELLRTLSEPLCAFRTLRARRAVQNCSEFFRAVQDN